MTGDEEDRRRMEEIAENLEVIWVARNDEPDHHYEYLAVDLTASDADYWRGYTFDNRWVARSRHEWRRVRGFGTLGLP